MNKVMTAQEIMAHVTNIVVQEEGREVNERVTYGRLKTMDRPVSVRATDERGMMFVRVGVPGMGNMSFDFNLFADEATEKKIDRFLGFWLERRPALVA